jgi:hypothetical protein
MSYVPTLGVRTDDEIERMIYTAGDAPLLALFDRVASTKQDEIEEAVSQAREEERDKAFEEGRETGRSEGEEHAKDVFERIFYRHFKALSDAAADLCVVDSDLRYILRNVLLTDETRREIESHVARLGSVYFRVSGVRDEIEDPEWTYLNAQSPGN